MKSAFVLHHALVGIAYPCAFAAEAAGLLPASVVSLPALAGYYVGAGVLALACDDYREQRTANRRETRPATRTKPASVREPAAAIPAWASRTFSA